MTTPEEKMIDTRGITLASEALGDTDSPPVLLVMGATASLAWWPDTMFETLAVSGCRVVRYDHRDTGRSTTVPPGEGSYSVEDMVDDLWAVADAHGFEQFHLVAMSLGGYLSQIASLQKPERVLSLTLIATEPLDGCNREVPPISPKFMEHFAQMEKLDWNDKRAVTEFMVESARLSAGSGAPFSETEARERAEREIARSSNVQSAFNHSTLQGGDAYIGRMKEITTPTLVLQGDDDPIVALPNGQSLADNLPNARLHVLRGVGHELPIARLPEILSEILDFIAERHR